MYDTFSMGQVFKEFAGMHDLLEAHMVVEDQDNWRDTLMFFIARAMTEPHPSKRMAIEMQEKACRELVLQTAFSRNFDGLFKSNATRPSARSLRGSRGGRKERSGRTRITGLLYCMTFAESLER